MEQMIAQLSPVFISTVTAIIGACLVWVSSKAHQYLNNMDISEKFKKDLFATNDQIVTSLKKIVATSSASLRQKLADGKLSEAELLQLQKDVYKEVKGQIPDVEKRLEAHMTNGGKYVADTILGEIESGNKITAL